MTEQEYRHFRPSGTQDVLRWMHEQGATLTFMGNTMLLYLNEKDEAGPLSFSRPVTNATESLEHLMYLVANARCVLRERELHDKWAACYEFGLLTL